MSGKLGGCSGARTGAAERGAAPPPAPGSAQAHAAGDEGRGCTLELTAGGEPSTPALGAPALSAVPARLLAGAASTSGGGPRKRRCEQRAGRQACCMGFGAALRAGGCADNIHLLAATHMHPSCKPDRSLTNAERQAQGHAAGCGAAAPPVMPAAT